MSWIPLIVFSAVLLFAYYVADKLDKKVEKKSQHQDSAGGKRQEFIS